MSTLIAPQQCMQALDHANTVRLARAGLKREIRAGTLTAATVALDPPWFCQRMTVSELLRAQVRWGRTRTRRLLAEVEIGEMRPLGKLTPRQRTALAEALGGA